MTVKPEELKLPLVVPPQLISKVSAALENIPVLRSSLKANPGVEFDPSSRVNVPSN